MCLLALSIIIVGGTWIVFSYTQVNKTFASNQCYWILYVKYDVVVLHAERFWVINKNSQSLQYGKASINKFVLINGTSESKTSLA